MTLLFACMIGREIAMESEHPLTDAEWERQRALYEDGREVGYPPFSADFAFAERFEEALRKIAGMDYSRAAINGMGFDAVSEAKSALGL